MLLRDSVRTLSRLFKVNLRFLAETAESRSYLAAWRLEFISLSEIKLLNELLRFEGLLKGLTDSRLGETEATKH